MALPSVTLVGRITQDATLKQTNSGKYVTTLRIACNDRKKDEAGNWVDGDSVFIDVTVWRAAEAVAKLPKGTEVLAIGTLKQRSYEKDGQQRTAYEVVADFIGSALRDAANQTTGFAQVNTTPAASDPWATPLTAPAADNAPF